MDLPNTAETTVVNIAIDQYKGHRIHVIMQMRVEYMQYTAAPIEEVITS